MMINCLCLLAGAYSLELFQQLPSANDFFAIFLVVAMLGYRARTWAPLSAFAGLVVMALAAHSQISNRLDSDLHGEQLILNVRIGDFPERNGDSLRLIVRPLGQHALPEKIRLTWLRTEAQPKIGEVWHLSVRLRRPRGYANPGGFDYEGWLFRQRIGATGYVVAEEHNYQLKGESGARINRLRHQVVERISAIVPRDDAGAVLMAIAVGARHAISREQWDLYAATGTSHLMAISGLHIGLAGGGAYLICWAIFAPFFKRRNLRDTAIVGAIIAAGAYATVSGFAVPAQRAMLMAIIAGFALIFRRKVAPSELLGITATLVFLAEPLAILAPGFKLSFAAVAILFFVARQHVSIDGNHFQRLPCIVLTNGKRLLLLQLALLTGLFPLSVMVFERFTLVAPAANLVVMPVFNFVTVPLSLAGMALDGPLQPAGDRLFICAYQSIRLVLWIVTKFSEPGFLSFPAVHSPSAISAILPALYLLAPAGWPGRRFALIAMITVTSYRPLQPPEGCLDFHALDVGQGLAVVVQSQSHAMLFDTGPSFQGGSNTAELVILPFLTHLGISRLDRVIVSHADLDHSGGIRSIIENTEVGKVFVGELLSDLGLAQRQCLSGDRWNWDGIGFTVLHPRRDARWAGNNSSCVLEINVGNQYLLLAGDIESPIEKLLVHQAALRRSQVVFVPHHGSRTSSSAEFVLATRPDLAVVSAGYGNRWGFPKDDVVRRWQGIGATVLSTATSGAISQRFCRNKAGGPFREERTRAARYWHEKPLERP